MSHNVVVKTRFQDLDAFRAILPSLGLEWRGEQQTFKSFTEGKCTHAIAVAGNHHAYEAGLIPNKDGKSWDLLFDSWEGGAGLLAHIGPEARLLRQAYSLEVAKRQALRQGFSVRQLVSTHGKPMLELRKNVDW